MSSQEYKLILLQHCEKAREWVVKNNRPEYYKYYHLKTVENLIHHFDRLKEDDKVLAFNDLKAYLEFIKEISPYEVKAVSKDVYLKFVYPIALNYYTSLGFVPYTRWAAIFLPFGILLFFFFIFGLPNASYIIAFLIFLALMLWILNNKRKKQVFGYKY